MFSTVAHSNRYLTTKSLFSFLHTQIHNSNCFPWYWLRLTLHPFTSRASLYCCYSAHSTEHRLLSRSADICFLGRTVEHRKPGLSWNQPERFVRLWCCSAVVMLVFRGPSREWARFLITLLVTGKPTIPRFVNIPQLCWRQWKYASNLGRTTIFIAIRYRYVSDCCRFLF